MLFVMALSPQNKPHPKVQAAINVTTPLAALFTILAAVGVVVPNDVQNTASILLVDVAAAVPIFVAYFKRVTA